MQLKGYKDAVNAYKRAVAIAERIYFPQLFMK